VNPQPAQVNPDPAQLKAERDARVQEQLARRQRLWEEFNKTRTSPAPRSLSVPR
jgi:hypothetical protein